MATLCADGYYAWKGDDAQCPERTGHRLDVYSAPQPAPDVSALVEALEAVHERFGPCRGEFIFSKRHALDKVAAALATYRKETKS